MALRFLIVRVRFRILRVIARTLDGGQFQQRLPLFGKEVSFGDFQSASADFVQREGGVGLYCLWGEEGVVLAALLVGLGRESLDFVLLFLLPALAWQYRGQVFLFAHAQFIQAETIAPYQ